MSDDDFTHGRWDAVRAGRNLQPDVHVPEPTPSAIPPNLEDDELNEPEDAAPASDGEWRRAEPDEIFEPGRSFRVDVNSGQTEVLEPADASAAPHTAPTLLDMTLDLAARGIPVFPCDANKRPLIKGGKDFSNASTDPNRIREMWEKAGPAAKLVGVPTGRASGFDVLDVDPRHNGDAWEIENSDRLDETRMHGTPSGGRHYLYRHADGVRNIQDGKTIAPGIDVRGQGGYVCFPPSGGYSVIHEAELADWPDWLLPLVRKAARPPPPPPDPASYATPERIAENRLRGFIDREVRRVRDAPVGARHGARLAAARSIGGVAAEAGLSDIEAEEMLIAAKPPEVEEEKERRTIRDGLAYGRAAPIDLNRLPDSAQIRGPRRQRGNGHVGNGAADHPEAQEEHAEQAGRDTNPPNDEPPSGPRPRRKGRTDGATPYTPTDPTGLWDPWDDPPPPAWPNAILAQQAEDTLALMSLRDGIDIGTLAMTHIAAGSAAAPKDARFFAYNARATGWCVPPIFWAMIVGDSGFRKTILGQFFAPLRDAQASLWRPYAIALRNWYAAPANGRGPKPTEPHSFIVDDFTVEALQRILAATSRGSGVVTDELAGLFEFDRYRQGSGGAGSAARGFLLAAYEDESRAVHRVSRDGANIEHTGLSLFGGIQADRLADFKDLAKDGLLQRFAPIRTPPAVAARPAIDVGRGVEHMHAAVARLCCLEGKNYTTTPDGTALIQDTEQTAFGYATITDYAAGWPGFCRKLHGTHARLALILHMLETPGEPVISTDTVHRAHRLVHSFVLQHATDFYASIPGSSRERLRDIAGWLLTRHDGYAAPDQWERIVASDLTNNVKACRPLTSKGITDVLDPFVTRGWLTPENDFPGNRAWFFDPAIRAAMAQRQIAERNRRAAIRTEIDRLAAKRQT